LEPAFKTQILNSIDKSQALRIRIIVPENPSDSDISLEKVNVRQLAEQLCLYQQNIYLKIQPKEFFNCAWSKNPDKAPNIIKWTTHFNHLSNWVASTIVKESTLRKQIKITKFFMTLFLECRSLNNFNAMMAINCAFQMTSVYMLKTMWEKF